MCGDVVRYLHLVQVDLGSRGDAEAVWTLLYHQVAADYPKIRAMRDEGTVNVICPSKYNDKRAANQAPDGKIERDHERWKISASIWCSGCA